MMILCRDTLRCNHLEASETKLEFSVSNFLFSDFKHSSKKELEFSNSKLTNGFIRQN